MRGEEIISWREEMNNHADNVVHFVVVLLHKVVVITHILEGDRTGWMLSSCTLVLVIQSFLALSCA
jgi:uncharacterized membrane protein YjdF